MFTYITQELCSSPGQEHFLFLSDFVLAEFMEVLQELQSCTAYHVSHGKDPAVVLSTG